LVGGEGIASEEELGNKKASLGCPGPETGTPYIDIWRALRPDDEGFTFWSYRFSAKLKNRGWRLDYFVASPSLMDHVVKIFRRAHLHGSSDHVPLGLILDFEKFKTQPATKKKTKAITDFFGAKKGKK